MIGNLPEKKLNPPPFQRNRLIYFLLFLCLCFSGFMIYAYFYPNSPLVKRKLSSGEKIYQNAIYQFSLKYPEDWFVDEVVPDEIVSFTSLSSQTPIIPPDTPVNLQFLISKKKSNSQSQDKQDKTVLIRGRVANLTYETMMQITENLQLKDSNFGIIKIKAGNVQGIQFSHPRSAVPGRFPDLDEFIFPILGGEKIIVFDVFNLDLINQQDTQRAKDINKIIFSLKTL